MSRQGTKRGFTLIELAIVLAVASLLFGGLWRLMASGSTQLRDQATADQQKKLIDATRAYLQSSKGLVFVSNISGTNHAFLTIPGGSCSISLGDFCSFLPSGFTTTTQNPYGQTYVISVRKDSGEPAGTQAANYSFMILTQNGETIPDTSGGRISSMIGGDGGFVYGTDLGSGGAPVAYGSYGAWVFDTNIYGVAGAAGHVASRSYVGLNAQQNTPWLARVSVPTPLINGVLPDFNTLRTNTYMLTSSGSQPVSGTNDFFLGNNTLFGGTSTSEVAGSLSNIHHANFNGTTISDNPPLIVSSYNSCSVTGTPALCHVYAVQVNGDQIVTGRLDAVELWTGKFIYNSDARMKHDIKLIPHVLEDLARIRGLSFVMNGGSRRHLGLLAQEVEKVYPEAVSTDRDGMKGIDYVQIVGPLVAAVNELKDRNEALEQKVSQLTAQIEKLQKTVDRVKK